MNFFDCADQEVRLQKKSKFLSHYLSKSTLADPQEPIGKTSTLTKGTDLKFHLLKTTERISGIYLIFVNVIKLQRGKWLADEINLILIPKFQELCRSTTWRSDCFKNIHL